VQTADILEMVFVVSTIPLTLALPIWLQRALLRRMTPARRSRAWPENEQLARTYLCATSVPLGAALSMIPFCWVTRKQRGPLHGALAVVLGVLWAALIVATIEFYGFVWSVVLHLLGVPGLELAHLGR
jgi:hypothetical protein